MKRLAYIALLQFAPVLALVLGIIASEIAFQFVTLESLVTAPIILGAAVTTISYAWFTDCAVRGVVRHRQRVEE